MGVLNMQRVLITGAAQGVGKAMAFRFAKAGAEIILTDLNSEVLEATRQELAATGARCRAFTLDVTNEEQVLAVRDQLHQEAGKIDVLVNNAGVVFGGPFLEVPLAKHRLTYRVNVEGLVTMTHAFLPDLIDSPRGHAVFIASASGFVGLPNGSTYASSKWAVIGFAESIRAELKHLGHKRVGVSTICPTYINTGMFEGVEPPKTTHMLNPDTIAEKVVEAVEKRRIWVLEPWVVKITPFLKNCLPTPVADFLSDAFGANTSMDHWQGHSTAPKKGDNDANQPQHH